MFTTYLEWSVVHGWALVVIAVVVAVLAVAAGVFEREDG